MDESPTKISRPSGASSKPRRRTGDGEPLGEQVIQEGRRIAEQYAVVVRKKRDGCYFAHGLEMPGAITHQPTAEEAVAVCRDLMAFGVAGMLDEGMTPPAPVDFDQFVADQRSIG